MIKINLLFGRGVKKKVGLRKELILLILPVIIFIIVITLIHWKISKDKEETLTQISHMKKSISNYQSQIAEVNRYKETQKLLQNKLDIINSLQKERLSPSKVLDEISIYKPEKMHLESLKKVGSKLGIEGIALDDETVALFMTNLRKSKVFKNIDLVVSEQIEQSKIKFKKFILSCEIFLI